MSLPVVVDASALIEAALIGRPRHEVAVDTLNLFSRDLVVPAFCVAEASHIIGRAAGWKAEAAFLEGLRSVAVADVHADDLGRCAELVRRYDGFPLGGVDASVVALAERLDTDLIATLDHRHFWAIRPRHCEYFRLLPEI